MAHRINRIFIKFDKKISNELWLKSRTSHQNIIKNNFMWSYLMDVGCRNFSLDLFIGMEANNIMRMLFSKIIAKFYKKYFVTIFNVKYLWSQVGLHNISKTSGGRDIDRKSLMVSCDFSFWVQIFNSSHS